MIIKSQELYNKIGKATLIIIILTLFDKVLAIIKEMITAYRFGVSQELDIFNIAYAFPGLVVLFFSGAFNSAFVPVYLDWINRFDRNKKKSMMLGLCFICAVFFLILTLACFFISPFIFSIFGYGFTIEQKKIGFIMEKLLVFLMLIDGIGIFFSSILHAEKKFISLKAAPYFINFSIILLILLWRSSGIYAIIFGFLLGSFLKLCYMIYALNREDNLFVSGISFDLSEFKKLFFLFLPLLGSQLIANANILVDQVMATKLSSGAVSTLRYAYRINDIPIQVIFIALSSAIFPYISEQANKNDYDGLRDVFKKSLIFLGVITFPIITIVSLFSNEIVSILLQRGAFSAIAAEQTSKTLLYYNFGLYFYAYTFLNGAFFSAIKDTKPLFYLGILSVILNISFNYVFMNILGTKGIALSTTFTLGIISIIFVLLLKKRLGFDELSVIYKNLALTGMLSLVIFIIGYFLSYFMILLNFNKLIYVPLISSFLIIFYLFLICCIRVSTSWI